MEEKNNIKVQCNEITKDGTLICNTDMKNATEMMKRGITPQHTQINVKDNLLDSSQIAVQNESIDVPNHSEADSAKKQSCGCTQTPEFSKDGSSEAKNPPKSGEN